MGEQKNDGKNEYVGEILVVVFKKLRKSDEQKGVLLK
jgi:hypothetical protein